MGVQLKGERLKKGLTRQQLAAREAYRKNSKATLEAERNRKKQP